MEYLKKEARLKPPPAELGEDRAMGVFLLA